VELRFDFLYHIGVQTRWQMLDDVRLLSVAALLALLAPACGQGRREPLGSAQATIIQGAPDTSTTAAVLIRHRDKSSLCTGVAIASDLVLTAHHCTVMEGPAGLTPLAEVGFQVGFGPDEERMQPRFVTSVEWIENTEDRTLADIIAAGEDVALLRLTEPIPPDAAARDVMLTYTPRASDDLWMVGYGVSSLETGSVGARLAASVTPAGFDAMTGVLEVTGPSACFGDSGGPLLLEPAQGVVGVVSEVGGSDGGFCDVGLTFASTVANPRVRAFLEEACVSAGGCGPPVVDAGILEPPPAPDAAPTPAPAADAAASVRSDAQAPDGGSAAAPRRARGSSCSASSRGSAPAGPGAAALALAALVPVVRRLRRRPLPWLTGALVAAGCSGDQEVNQTSQLPDAGRGDATRGSGGAVSTSPTVDATAPRPPEDAQDGAAFDPDGSVSGGDAGLRDATPVDADAEPVSLFCGDFIRDPVLEECDDGPGDEDDGCTPDCRARSTYATVPLASVDGGPVFGVARRLGSGVHVIAANRDGFAIVFQEADTAARVYLQAFDGVGHRLGDPILVSEGRSPAGVANPVVALVSSGVYAVAWTDGMTGTPDVVLRRVDAQTRALGPVRTAHDAASGVQQDPDILRVNGEWIVAWTDLFNVHARRFNANLLPAAPEEALPAIDGLQAGVALAEHAGSWALGWRVNQGGFDSIHVTSDGLLWQTEVHLPGPSGDRPVYRTIDF
jgi:cysteine-rich repeat protein